jgi:hypothetical protein
MARIGKMPIIIPSGVEINITDDDIMVKGQKGELKEKRVSAIECIIEGNVCTVNRLNEEKASKQLHGLDFDSGIFATEYSSIYPSLFITLTISLFILEFLICKSACFAIQALRIFVSISATGSETAIFTSYQLDFLTPGIAPSLANFLKHTRQRLNLLIYPLGLPHTPHRFTLRVENLGGRCAYKN